MSEAVFKFEKPPPMRQQPTGSQIEAAQKLRAKPGEWALVVKCATRSSAAGMASAIRTGRTSTWLPAGDFDAVSRTVDGEFRVYARYMGPGKLPSDD